MSFDKGVDLRVKSNFANVRLFGATGDGSTNDLAAIQAAEDYVDSLGGGIVFFPKGEYVVSDFVLKKANINWIGNGTIKHDGSANAYPIVKCQQVDNWTIDGLTILAAIYNVAGHTSGIIDDYNCCISVVECDRWTIKNCWLRKGSSGLRILKSNDFIITQNQIDSEAGEDMEAVWNGTAKSIASGEHGGITFYPAYNVAGYSYDDGIGCSKYIISENRLNVAGLDSGIQLASQIYEIAPGIVCNNWIHGARHGIMVYKGANSEPVGVETWSKHISINENHIEYCYENGIYIRTEQGVLVQGNYLFKNGFVGNFASQTAGGIVTRIITDEFGVASVIASLDTGNQIIDNTIIDTGKPGSGASDEVAGIVVRNNFLNVQGNTIVNTQESGFDRVDGSGISGFAGDVPQGCYIVNNKLHNLAYGITLTAANFETTERFNSVINGNVITRVKYGIELGGSYLENPVISHNSLDDVSIKAFYLRYTLGAKFIANVINNAALVIDIDNGTFLTQKRDISIRLGASTEFINNVCSNCDAYLTVGEGAPGDGDTYHRFRNHYGNSFNGDPLRLFNGTNNGNPVSGWNHGRVWYEGETHHDTRGVSAGGYFGKICVDAGVYGAISSTGNSSNASTTVSAISNINEFWVGAIIDIAGVGNGSFTVTAVDYDNDTITLDDTPDTTTTGAAISLHAPTFKDFAAIVV